MEVAVVRVVVVVRVPTEAQILEQVLPQAVDPGEWVVLLEDPPRALGGDQPDALQLVLDVEVGELLGRDQECRLRHVETVVLTQQLDQPAPGAVLVIDGQQVHGSGLPPGSFHE